MYLPLLKRWPVSFSPLYVGLISVVAHAESASEDTIHNAYQLDEIVVTATKTGATPLQAVPASITVVEGDAIYRAGMQNVEDIQRQTPGLNLTRNGQWTRLYLRGIGTNLDFIGSDPSVTVHVDGIYQARTATVLDDFLEVERVEVLRGPQGTLYGRNSTGGTINIITKLPDAKTKSKVSAEIGSDSLHRITAAASGGLGSNDVIGSLALMQTEHDPYVTNVADDGVDGLLDDNSVRANGSVQWFFHDDAHLILRADYTDTDRSTGAYKTTGLGITGAPAPLAGLASTPSDPFQINVNAVGQFTDLDSWGSSIELNWLLGDEWSLTSLSGYRAMDFAAIEDTDGSDVNVLVTVGEEDQHQVSEELRLNYETDDLTWVSGVFWFREQHHSDVTVNATNYLASNKTKAHALFTQATYGLSDHMHATLGLRYSDETKRFNNVNTQNNPSNIVFALNQTADWQDWSPKLALDYQFENHNMIYATASKGFKSGGFNMTASDAEFDPEKVWSYEVGAKLQSRHSALRSNLALFYYNYSDLQVSDFTQPGVLSISNAADATIKGFEIENQWLAAQDWIVTLNYAYLDATYDHYFAPQGAALVDVSGNRLNASPRHKVSTAVQYFLTTESGIWGARVEYSWQDKQYFTAFNQDVSAQGAYGILNAQLTLQATDEQWDVQFYADNITDKAYSTSSREFPAVATGVTRDINPPRTIGTRLTYHFH
jgi:iron complex outermembrane receptor protein